MGARTVNFNFVRNSQFSIFQFPVFRWLAHLKRTLQCQSNLIDRSTAVMTTTAQISAKCPVSAAIKYYCTYNAVYLLIELHTAVVRALASHATCNLHVYGKYTDESLTHLMCHPHTFAAFSQQQHPRVKDLPILNVLSMEQLLSTVGIIVAIPHQTRSKHELWHGMRRVHLQQSNTGTDTDTAGSQCESPALSCAGRLPMFPSSYYFARMYDYVSVSKIHIRSGVASREINATAE